VRYADLTTVREYAHDDLETACRKIRDLLDLRRGEAARRGRAARLPALGGLDSSLVCAISAKLLHKKIRTFAIGMDLDAIDLKYAREAADFMGADHTEVIMTRQQVLDTLPEVIGLLGTWDITTIRASMGMYLCCKAIHEQTDVRVLMTGEISDELFGYKYTDFAPSARAFQDEAKKRVDELLHVRRAAGRPLHLRQLPRGPRAVRRSGLRQIRHVHRPCRLKLNTYDMGKYLLRHAFENDRILPDRHPLAAEGGLLRRRRPLDGGRSQGLRRSPSTRTRSTSESAANTASPVRLRRKVFSTARFSRASIPARRPWSRTSGCRTRAWKGCNVSDPSARVLSNYGGSGE
jgi:asparagine synthase (glutamine-hydrolysing)